MDLFNRKPISKQDYIDNSKNNYLKLKNELIMKINSKINDNTSWPTILLVDPDHILLMDTLEEYRLAGWKVVITEKVANCYTISFT